jgi:hypothetical protein
MPRFVPRFRKQATGPSRPALPPPGVLRRQRRALQKAREQLLRDLGGLMFEMFKQDRFRADLVQERCQELLELDDRLGELDALLAAARDRLPATRCYCGAPLLWGSHFCANCGRPVGEKAVVACDVCGHALPADAAFCASCGAAAGPPGMELEAGPVEEGAVVEQVATVEEEESAAVEDEPERKAEAAG